MNKECCNNDCGQGRTCPTITRAPLKIDNDPNDYVEYDMPNDITGTTYLKSAALLAACVAVVMLFAESLQIPDRLVTMSVLFLFGL